MSENQLDIKPKNLKLHDFLVRKMAVKMMLPEKWIDTVISDEKKGINEALKRYQEVEISGFGKFILSQIKLRKKIVSLERILNALQCRYLDDPNNPDTISKLELTHKEMIYYKSKLKQNEN